MQVKTHGQTLLKQMSRGEDIFKLLKGTQHEFVQASHNSVEINRKYSPHEIKIRATAKTPASTNTSGTASDITSASTCTTTTDNGVSAGTHSPNVQELERVNLDEAKFPFLDQFKNGSDDASSLFDSESEGFESNLTVQGYEPCEIDQSISAENDAYLRASEDSDGSAIFLDTSKQGTNELAQKFLEMKDARKKKRTKKKKPKSKKSKGTKKKPESMAFDISRYTDKELEAAVEKSKMICKMAEERQKAWVDEIAARIFSSDDEEDGSKCPRFLIEFNFHCDFLYSTLFSIHFYSSLKIRNWLKRVYRIFPANHNVSIVKNGYHQKDSGIIWVSF